MSNPKRFLIAFAASFVVLLFGGEAAYRASLYREFVIDAAYGVSAYSHTFTRRPLWAPGELLGFLPPSTEFTVRRYWTQGELLATNRIHTNSLGWVSRREYPVAKPAGEIRVAFLGDSLTGSVTNDRPWTEVVQRELARTMPQVLVLNLGAPNMGLPRQSQITLPIAQALSADLVVANFTVEGLGFTSAPPSRTPPEPPLLVSGIEVPCRPDRPIGTGCVVAPIWYSATQELAPAQVQDIKRRAARAALNRTLLAPRPMLFADASRGQSAYSDRTPDQQEDDALNALLAMRSAHPNLIVTLNPLAWYYDPATRPKQMASFLARARTAGIEIVDMRERMPPPPPDLATRWYNLPSDGHWNDAGAELYGRAMTQLILERMRH